VICASVCVLVTTVSPAKRLSRSRCCLGSYVDCERALQGTWSTAMDTASLRACRTSLVARSSGMRTGDNNLQPTVTDGVAWSVGLSVCLQCELTLTIYSNLLTKAVAAQYCTNGRSDGGEQAASPRATSPLVSHFEYIDRMSGYVPLYVPLKSVLSREDSWIIQYMDRSTHTTYKRASQSVHPYLQGAPMYSADRQTDIQTDRQTTGVDKGGPGGPAPLQWPGKKIFLLK